MPKHFYPPARERVAAPPGLAGLEARPLLSELGVRFAGGARLDPGAATFAHVQLWNPEGSPVHVLAEMILAQADSAEALTVETSRTRMDTLVRPWRSLDEGHEVGVAELRTQDSAAQTGDNVGALTPFSGSTIPLPDFAVVLEPGEGVYVRGANVDVPVTVTFIGREYRPEMLAARWG